MTAKRRKCRRRRRAPTPRSLVAQSKMHSKMMKTLALVAIVAIVGVAAADVHPFTEPKVTGKTAFLETFSSGLGKWTAAKDDKYNGALLWKM